MKWFKLLGILTLGAAFVAVASLATWSASPASANNGPHGGYTLTTDACAGCHRAHTAIGEELLVAESVYGLCTTCHGGVSGSTIDVVHGVRTGDSAQLNGGGFEQYQGETVGSSHSVEGVLVDGTPASGIGTAWGSQDGTGDAGVGVSGTLECTSCHNPHGSSNYRILKDENNGYPYGPAGFAGHRWVPNDPDLLNWVSYQVLATRDDGFDYAFTSADCFAGTPTPVTAPNGTKCKANYTSGIVSGSTAVPDKTKGMNAFCATCHKSYLTLSGSAGVPSTDASRYLYPGTQDANDGHSNVARFRHAVERTYGGNPKQPLRFAARGSDPDPAGALTYDAFGCLTCHFAHGTNAVAEGYAVGVDPTNDSALLFYDNRGVCVSCHQTVGNPATVTPVPTNTPVPPTATPTP